MSNYLLDRVITLLKFGKKTSEVWFRGSEGMLLEALSNRWSSGGLVQHFRKWAGESEKSMTPLRFTLAFTLYIQNTRLVSPGANLSKVLEQFKVDVEAALQGTPSAPTVARFYNKLRKALNSPANAAVVAEINAYNPPETKSASSGGGGAKAPTIPAAANGDETKHGSPPKGGTVVVTVAVPVAAASVKQYSPAEQAERTRLIAIIRERNNRKLEKLHEKVAGLQQKEAGLDQKIAGFNQEEASLNQEKAQLDREIEEQHDRLEELAGPFDRNELERQFDRMDRGLPVGR